MTVYVSNKQALLGILVEAKLELDELLIGIHADTVDWGSDRIYSIQSRLRRAEEAWDYIASGKEEE